VVTVVTMVKAHVYIGRDRFKDWLKDLEGKETVSPGGAAIMFACSRQWIHQLMREGRLETWLFYEREGRPVTYAEISVESLEEVARSLKKDISRLA
jgi:hypothetical protein